MTLQARLGLDLPLFQAPMAGVSTPALAAEVCAAGGLGALGLGAATPARAAQDLAELRARTDRPIHANLFCHTVTPPDAARDARWIARTAPLFAQFDAAPPDQLQEIYPSFCDDDGAMMRVLLDCRPEVVSFHFGLPRADQMAALRATGALLLVSVTSPDEAQAAQDAGMDAVIAQGWEAGGHRGIFDPAGPDARMTTEALTRALAGPLPVVAAGGLMSGSDIRAALGWGAQAAQLGTAFIGCPESAADAGYRARLARGGATEMTPAISGRPARCLSNAFTAWAGAGTDVAPYPRAYDLGKALNAAAKTAGESGFGAQWAGMGADRAEALPARDLVTRLAAEFRG